MRGYFAIIAHARFDILESFSKSGDASMLQCSGVDITVFWYFLQQPGPPLNLYSCIILHNSIPSQCCGIRCFFFVPCQSSTIHIY